MKWKTQNKSVRQLLTVGWWEGVSYLALLLVAMPLKYYADMPLAVTIVGSLHGVLFLWFIALVYKCYYESAISFGKAVLAFLLSLVPFGTFFLDKAVLEKNKS
ncbi:MAG: DUF3817 domain-containing protein [Flavobacteriales bacterium]|nr:DUF3817 domain-containing protein [Flavobacteriales bacterium]